MRTMKKSGAFAALAVALLVVAMLVTTGCRVPETGSVIDSDIGIDIGIGTETAKKTGSLRLVFADNKGARTVMPDVPLVASILGYQVTLSPTPAGPPVVVKTVGTGGNLSAISTLIDNLAVGAYEVEVIAYKDADRDFPIAVAKTGLTGGISNTGFVTAAGGVNTPVASISIVEGTPANIYVTVKPYGVVTGENGTFTWAIQNSLGAGVNFTATVRVSDFPGGTNPVTSGTITPLANLTGTFGVDPQPDLASGYKWVEVALTGPLGDTFRFRDIAHIYQNLNTTFAYEFLPSFVVIPSTGGGRIYLEYVQDNVIFLFEVAAGDESDINTMVGNGDGKWDTPIKMSHADTTYPKEIVLSLSVSGITIEGQEWYVGSATTPAETDEEFTINIETDTVFGAGNPPGKYQIMLVAYYDSKPYTMLSPIIYIEIVD
jgi:hypothetical protein